jgi:hypothetical protein
MCGARGGVCVWEGEQGSGPAWAAQLRRRQRTHAAASPLAPHAARVVVLPRLTPTDFAALLAASDVVVDSTPYSSFTVTLEALAMGTPVVTLRGRTVRGCVGRAWVAGARASVGVAGGVPPPPFRTAFRTPLPPPTGCCAPLCSACVCLSGFVGGAPPLFLLWAALEDGGGLLWSPSASPSGADPHPTPHTPCPCRAAPAPTHSLARPSPTPPLAHPAPDRAAPGRRQSAAVLARTGLASLVTDSPAAYAGQVRRLLGQPGALAAARAAVAQGTPAAFGDVAAVRDWARFLRRAVALQTQAPSAL